MHGSLDAIDEYGLVYVYKEKDEKAVGSPEGDQKSHGTHQEA